MSAEDVPFLAALVFPGFFAIQAFTSVAGPAKLTDTMRITWSFVYSVPIYFGTHGFFRHVAMVSSSSLAPPAAIARSPADAPLWFLISLYVTAGLAGYFGGRLWLTRRLDAILLRAGLDIRRHRPILSQVLGQRGYVDVKTKDGQLFRGWPLMYNSDPEDSFVYLIRVRRQNGEGKWIGARDVLLTMDIVARIYPVDPERPLSRAVAASEPQGA